MRNLSKNLKRKNKYEVIFVAPCHDTTTKITSKWLMKVSGLLKVPSIELFKKNTTTKKLDSSLSEINGKTLLIFFGHGINEAFITEKMLGKKPIKLYCGECSILCDSSNFKQRSDISIIGYCCCAANVLGEDVRRRGNNKYLGFTDELVFYFGSEERENAFLSPVENIIKYTIPRGKMDADLPVKLKNLFLYESKKWDKNKYDDAHAIVSMCLEELGNIIDPKI